MENHKQELLDTENQQIISRRETKSSNSVREHSEHVPFDLLIEIFSRVSAKSIARFRCLSKFWASIFVSSDFSELFLTKSLNRPRIFFTIVVNKEVLFFSSPQPQNPEENCCLVSTRHKKLPKHVQIHKTYISSLLGLVLLQSWKERSLMICNLITGESITLPKPEVNSIDIGKNFLCYDPTNKQFKVLCTRWVRHDRSRSTSHRVLTLDTGKLCWRTIECKPCYTTYFVIEGEICINGVLYYGSPRASLIVCFDVRSEKLSYISINDEDMFQGDGWTLTNYKGKLGVHLSLIHRYYNEILVLWVLENVVNNKWSKKICILTPLWKKMVYKNKLYGVRVTCGGEIVFSPIFPSNRRFYIFYYNFERNTFTRVEIQEIQGLTHHGVDVSTSLDFVENLRLM